MFTIQKPINILDETEVKNLIADLLNRTAHSEFSITLEERKAMIDILKTHPNALKRTTPRIMFQTPHRKPDLDGYKG